MNKLSVAGLVLSIFVFAFGLYVHFKLAPDAEIAIKQSDILMAENPDNFYGSTAHEMEIKAMSDRTDGGIYTLCGASFVLLLCIYPAIKKNKLALIGLLLSAISFFVGAAYGTHMFS